jgi:hypothetical protein
VHPSGRAPLRGGLQPAERYWTFQGIEAAIFGLLALALVALTVWWVRHRIS